MTLFIALVIALATLVNGLLDHQPIDPLSEAMVSLINSRNSSWTAGRNFVGLDMDHVRRLMGGKRAPRSLRLPRYQHDPVGKMPESFDARTQWPNCSSIGRVRDQGSCGSCWAVAAASAMSDRVCIRSYQKLDIQLSDEDILTCCPDCGTGCNGGYPSQAWNYWTTVGVVTGGLYGTDDNCMPYSIEPCEHHTSGPRPACKEGPTPKCSPTCISSYSETYDQDKHLGKSSYEVGPSIVSIQFEILNNGPVTALFDVYDDFLTYKSGVYQRFSDELVGGHVVKIIGWGTEGDLNYWLVANSWNSDWGDKGFFKIVRGFDECGFEEEIDCGIPLIS
ncbi:Cathepsin B [Halotydeus destructor]|nr:Cathepsin B [Halotydeus destructor]